MREKREKSEKERVERRGERHEMTRLHIGLIDGGLMLVFALLIKLGSKRFPVAFFLLSNPASNVVK